MVRQNSKRHLSFEQLDTRIALNSDAHPLNSIVFDLTPRSHGRSIELRSILLSDSDASVAIQRLEIQQVAKPHYLPTFELVRLSFKTFDREMNREMIGEAEGRVGSDRSIPSPTSRGSAEPFAAVLAVRPAVKQPFDNAGTSTISNSQPNASAPVKQDVQISGSHLGQSQNLSRPESSLPKPLSSQPQSNTLIAASPIRTINSTPISDSLIAKRDGNSVSVAPQATTMQWKSSLNEFVSVPTTAKTLSPTEWIVDPKAESAKPTKEGMLAFSMDVSSHPSRVEPTEGTSSSASRVRSQHSSEMLLRQMQKTQVDSIIDPLAYSAKRLPVPTGMIEIHDHVGSVQRQGFGGNASSNPFEVLQLFIGSTNMVQSRIDLEKQSTSAFGIGSESLESTELATSEDILVTLGIGAVLAIALRETRQRSQTDPFFATFRRRVAQGA